MVYLRISLSLVAVGIVTTIALAQDPSKAPPAPLPTEPPTEAETTLDEAIAKLDTLGPLKCKIHQEVDMLGEQFAIEGEYWYAGPYTFRLRLDVKGLPGSDGRMGQVSDGEILWDYTELLDQRYYYRLDLPELLERLQGEPFEKGHRDYILQQRMGLSGPKAMLEGLRQSVRFDRKLEDTVDDHPVWLIRGRWKDTTPLGIGPMGTVPAYIPSLVHVWIDKETGFPYRVLLQGKKRSIVAEPTGMQIDPATGRPVGRSVTVEEPPSEFLLTYTDLDTEPDFDALAFQLTVPDAELSRVRDRTPELMNEVEQIAVAIVQANRQQAAGASEPGLILDGVLDVPSPDAEAPTPTPAPLLLEQPGSER